MTSFGLFVGYLAMRWGVAGLQPRACAGETALLFNGIFNASLLSGFINVLRRNTKPQAVKQA